MVFLVLCVLLIPAVVLLVSRAADALAPDRAPNPLPQLAAFAPWAIPLWASAAAFAAASGRWTTAGPAAVALIVQLCWAIPSRRPAARPVSGPEAPAAGELTLVTVNALLGRADPAAIAGLVVRADADVLVVQELTLDLARALDDRLRAAGLRQAALHPAPGGAGTGIWSRWPIRPLRLLPSRDCAMPQVLVQPPGTSPVLVTGVHTVAPHPVRVGDWRADLQMLARAVRMSSGPQILAGDFNASRDHSGFRAILAAGTVDAADVAAAGTGLAAGFTWPADRACPPLTRLDHVLVSDGIAVHATSIETVPGTDHRAVVARLGLPVCGRADQLTSPRAGGLARAV